VSFLGYGPLSYRPNDLRAFSIAPQFGPLVQSLPDLSQECDFFGEIDSTALHPFPPHRLSLSRTCPSLWTSSPSVVDMAFRAAAASDRRSANYTRSAAFLKLTLTDRVVIASPRFTVKSATSVIIQASASIFLEVTVAGRSVCRSRIRFRIMSTTS